MDHLRTKSILKEQFTKLEKKGPLNIKNIIKIDTIDKSQFNNVIKKIKLILE